MPDLSKSAVQQTGSGQPRVWLVVGEKLGDNAQIVNLAEATGWNFELKKIFVKPRWATRKPWVRPTLRHIDSARSDSLEPPWPDLIITASRRLSCVGLWIKRQSGGRSLLIMVGQPRRLLDSFDLIVVATHYMLAPGVNVARHELPLMQVDPGVLETASRLWRSRLAEMPRPLTALMVGGPTGGLRFDLQTATDLFQKTLAGVEADRGSLYIATSRRTPPEVVQMLRQKCPESGRIFEYEAAASPSENPYHGLLGLADRFVVTTDSASMMVEVARLGRSLAIYPLTSETGFLEDALTAIGLLRPLSPRFDPQPAGGSRARMLYRLGRPNHYRDLSAIPRRLVEKGLASWLGDEWVHPSPFVDDELEAIAARIRALFAA